MSYLTEPWAHDTMACAGCGRTYVDEEIDELDATERCEACAEDWAKIVAADEADARQFAIDNGEIAA